MKTMKALALSLLLAGAATFYSSNAAQAHAYVCLCTDIVDFCYWADNH